MRQQPSWSQQLPHRRLLQGIRSILALVQAVAIGLTQLWHSTKHMMATHSGILLPKKAHGVEAGLTLGFM